MSHVSGITGVRHIIDGNTEYNGYSWPICGWILRAHHNKRTVRGHRVAARRGSLGWDDGGGEAW